MFYEITRRALTDTMIYKALELARRHCQRVTRPGKRSLIHHTLLVDRTPQQVI